MKTKKYIARTLALLGTAGVASAQSSGSATLTDASSRTPVPGVVKALAVTIASSWVNAATCADTLTFTIAGK